MLSKLFIHPEEKRLRSGWRILAHLILLLIISFFLAGPLLAFASLSPVFAFLGDEFLISVLAFTASIYLARRWFDRRSFRGLGLQWDADATRDLLFGIFMPALLMALVFLAEWAFGWLTFEGFAWQVDGFNPAAIGYWAAAFIMVGWYEELLTRGYWLQNLAEGLGMPLAVLISSAVFSLLHLINPSASIASVLGIFCGGLFLAYAYLRTGRLWLPIGLHIGWNFFQGPVFGFPVSGLASTRLLVHSNNGPLLITGGSFGPEAGLIILPTLALGAYLIYVYTQQRTPIALEDVA